MVRLLVLVEGEFGVEGGVEVRAFVMATRGG